MMYELVMEALMEEHEKMLREEVNETEDDFDFADTAVYYEEDGILDALAYYAMPDVHITNKEVEQELR